MRVAQRLYENGYITYMRTDSVNLSAQAITAARNAAKSLYGADHIPDAPRVYQGKTKNAQEAHEAIRPAGESFKTPGELAPELSRDEFALYDLIWKRTVASQMADAKKMQMRVDFDADINSAASQNWKKAIFRANGSVIVFPGFLAAYDEIVTEDGKDENKDEEATNKRLPAMTLGQAVMNTHAKVMKQSHLRAIQSQPLLKNLKSLVLAALLLLHRLFKQFKIVDMFISAGAHLCQHFLHFL
jgi:DNA topoisomerase-1